MELNPGPLTSNKSLSFAVWNLDSLPARDFARIPLIEGLLNSHDFDMFGVCESMLTENISNEDILISGFSPEPFRSDRSDDMIRLLLPEMAVFASTSRNLYLLKKDPTLKSYPKPSLQRLNYTEKSFYYSLILSPKHAK